MCADCLPGYSRDGRGGCKKCGEKGLNILFPVLVGCSILLILFLLVYSTIVKRGGAFDSSDGARKVFISYLQLAGLATTMKIPWPVDYVTLFRIEGMLSSVGEEFLDIRCALETPLPIATIEYYKILGYAIAPFVLVFLSVLGWNTCFGFRCICCCMAMSFFIRPLLPIFPTIFSNCLCCVSKWFTKNS